MHEQQAIVSTMVVVLHTFCMENEKSNNHMILSCTSAIRLPSSKHDLLLTRHSQESTHQSPDPFPCERLILIWEPTKVIYIYSKIIVGVSYSSLPSFLSPSSLPLFSLLSPSSPPPLPLLSPSSSHSTPFSSYRLYILLFPHYLLPLLPLLPPPLLPPSSTYQISPPPLPWFPSQRTESAGRLQDDYPPQNTEDA